jgi:hypothetical protein
VPIVLKSGILEPSGPVQACKGIALPFLPNKYVSEENNTKCNIVAWLNHALLEENGLY